MQGTVQIGEQSVDGACVLTVAGELDMAAAPHLSEKLNAVIRSGSGEVIVDLERVTFVDSTGLAVLLNALRRLTRVRRRMTVIIGNGAVRRAFDITRLHWTFEVADSVESALARSRAG